MKLFLLTVKCGEAINQSLNTYNWGGRINKIAEKSPGSALVGPHINSQSVNELVGFIVSPLKAEKMGNKRKHPDCISSRGEIDIPRWESQT